MNANINYLIKYAQVYEERQIILYFDQWKQFDKFIDNKLVEPSSYLW